MNKQIIATIAVVGLLTGSSAFAAEKVKLTDVPEPVQKTILAERGSTAQVKGITIERETKKGQTVYEVEFKEPGKNPKLLIGADGAVIKDNHASSGTEHNVLGLGSKKVDLSQVPAAVQTTIRSHGGNAEIARITHETKDGRMVYLVEFKEPGKNPKLWIAEDGSIVKTNGRQASGEAIDESAGADKHKLTYNDMPKPVQDAITAQKGNAPIEGIKLHKTTRDGKAVFAVEFEEKGKNTKLEIDEQGTVLKDNRK